MGGRGENVTCVEAVPSSQHKPQPTPKKILKTSN